MRLVLGLLAFLTVFAVAPGVAMAQRVAIAVGQVWTFKDARADTARVVIQKIESWENGGEAVHVSLYGLPKAAGFAGEVQHLPFERKALEASLDQLTDESAPADLVITEGYKLWKDGRGGIFTLSIADVIETVLGTMLGKPRSDGI